MEMNFIRRGSGRPLLLLHGIGGSWRSWQTILDGLAQGREVIAVDLPGFGDTPPLAGRVTIGTLADAVTAFLRQHDLLGIDAVGSSMGARLVLELARRGGIVGTVVSLDPGGFWQGWEIPFFYHTANVVIHLVRALQPVMPALANNVVTRTLLLAQYSAHPWQVPGPVVLDELRTYAQARSFDELLVELAYGEVQQGAPQGSITAPLVIGWGRQDRVCLPSQAQVALAKFPDAQLYWFDNCGHLPQWDQPAETTHLILAALHGEPLPASHAEQPLPTALGKQVPQAAVVAGVAALVAGGVWLLLRQRKG